MYAPNFDSQLLQELSKRLATASRQSLYLNAQVQQYWSRLDLADLDHLQAGNAARFLQTLLSQIQFEFPLVGNALTEVRDLEAEQRLFRRLNTLVIENNDYLSEYGVPVFGFGFPLVAWRDQKNPEHTIVAPLIIWMLEIERDLTQPSRWIIRRRPDSAIINNTVLTAHLLRERALQLPPLYGELLEDDLLNTTELSQWLYAFQYAFDPQTPPQRTQEYFNQLQNLQPQPIPAADILTKSPIDTPVLHWSGIFGLFRSPKEPLFYDLQRLLKPSPKVKAYFDALPVTQATRPAFMRHPFAMVETDPSQQRLIYTLAQGHHLIVQGAPGTGKSQTLTGLISNAVSNGARCLVVAEKRTAIETIYQQLKDIELGELAALVEDEYRDRAPLVQSVRDRHQNLGATTYQPSPNFVRVLNSSIGQMQQLQRYYHKLQQPLSGNWKWADVVGKWLEVSGQLPDKTAMNAAFQASAFKFSAEELDVISQILPEGETLFAKVKTLQHPFNALHDRFFQASNIHQVEDEIRKSLQNLLYVLDSAQRDLLACLFDYEQELTAIFSEHFTNQLSAVHSIEQLIAEHFKSGKVLLNKNTFGSKLLSVFVQGSKEADEAKPQIVQYFLQIIQEHRRYNYFQHDFYNINQAEANTEDTLKNLQEFQQKLSNWYGDIQLTISDTVNQLAPDRIHPHSSFRTKVADLIRNLDAFERNLGASQLLKVGFRYSSPNLRRRLSDLEALDKNMKQLEEKLPEFKDYHLLKYYWNNLSEAQRAAFRGLSTLNCANWPGVFAGWYYGALLAKHADEQIPREENYRATLQYWNKERGEVQQLLRQHTLRLWRARQAEAVQQYARNNQSQSILQLYNQRQRAGVPPTPLRDLIAKDVQLFSTFFPIVLVNPSMCATLLPLEPELFDVVIFDEASQLSLEGGAGALLRGKHKIVSGDSHQIPPASAFQHNSPVDTEKEELPPLPPFMVRTATQTRQPANESVLEFALADSTYQEELLQIHSRSQHPYLIDFSNAAFYGGRLIPMPAKDSYIPLEIMEIDGVLEQETNVKETRRVVELLLEIARQVPDADSTPKVGVITFTLAQRNQLLEWIQSRSIQDAEAAPLIQRLYQKGLFVKSFENIQGDECEVLVLSTTWGKAADGSFQPDFGWLHHDYGYRLLNVMITRASRKVFVVTSIPAEHYQQYAHEVQRKGNTGRGILYAYLTYAKAISTGDNVLRMNVINLVAEQCLQKAYHDDLDEGENLFEQQVRGILETQLMDYQLERDALYAGFKIPLIVKDLSAQPKLAIFFDLHPSGHSLEEAFAWDIFVEEHLQRLGMPMLRLWSYQWWNDVEGEKGRLWAAVQAATAQL